MHNLVISAQIILAGMLSFMPPGKSVFSRTVVDSCDLQCQSKNICEDPSILCAPPQFNSELGKYTRAENYDEGLRRYSVIAQAISEVSEEMSWETSSQACISMCSRGEYGDLCKPCLAEHPWKWSSKELQAALVVVMYGESGFRQDIHSGIGSMSKGYCEWRDQTTHKKVAAGAPNSAPVAGTCKSYCLAQINMGTPEGVKFGYRGQNLVGTDLESTKRCATAATKVLVHSRKMCTDPLVGFTGDWATGMFSAYGSGNSCKVMTGTAGTLKEAAWPAERATKFRNLLKHPRSLTDIQKTLLGIQKPGEVVSAM